MTLGTIRTAIALLLLALAIPLKGEQMKTYNGIPVPDPWPPQVEFSRQPEPLPPYLQSPPEVIPIDVGRQLFVDDFLIQRTTLTRTWHQATWHPENPVLVPDRPWENEEGPCAMPFSDGVWWDPAERLFKMWYMGGYVHATCYATSRDGLHWDKPALDVVPGTNVVHTVRRDSSTVWLDARDPDPGRRWKMFVYQLDPRTPDVYCSPDGIHWHQVAQTGPMGDRTTIFYNPFRGKWVYSVREYLPPPSGPGRVRRYWENADLIAGAKWQQGEPVPWTGADDLDPQRPEMKIPCELYNLDCVAYESVLIGLFDIWRGQNTNRPKPNDLVLGTSRDGFHWYRPNREPLIPVSERKGDWNWGNVQSAGGCCLVVGDELWFYVSGRQGVEGSNGSGVCATGIAVLRRDGFASMDAADRPGTLTTRPVTFTGKHLFVNAQVRGGLRVEVLDRAGKVIAPFTRANCRPVAGDSTRCRVQWQGTQDLAALVGQPVRFRFHLRDGSLYAFWVSPSAKGQSRGYVAAGGPGFTGPVDR